MKIPEFLIRRKSELSTLSERELSSILEFKKRAEEFEVALKRYSVVAMASHQRSDDVETRKSTFKANTPELDHLYLLSLKFRFFYAEKERTRFETVIGILRKSAKDEWARNYLDRVSAQYRGIMNRAEMSKEMGHPVSNKDMIKLWFNSEFFHSDLDKRESLENINSKISKNVSLFQLYTAISGVSTQINALYAIVHEVTGGHYFIYTPAHHFSKKKEVQA
ncbi:hypothetical protein SL034_005578 [Vibrio harveyi]|nr:hypothetical protein [Vibrio harveyi]